MNDHRSVIRRHSADLRCRARREDWMVMLINTVIVVLLDLPVQIQISGALGGARLDAPGGLALVSATALGICALAMLVPSPAVTTRPLHDAGKSGWCYAVTVVPLVGGLALIVLTVLDRGPSANRGGPSPQGPGPAGAVRTADPWQARGRDSSEPHGAGHRAGCPRPASAAILTA
jgi:uncharacterized membrane protein YhaH (DUF805 family)